MLNRQYGVAASSSIVKVIHPEDSQPNETMQGRKRHLPPKLNTVRPPRFDRIATNPSRMGPQLARRGTWNAKLLPGRSRQEPSSWSKADYSGSQIMPRHHHERRNMPVVPEAPTKTSHSNARPASLPVQPTGPSTWVPRYRSISPKLPPEPIRRRTPQDGPRSTDQHPAGPQPPPPRSSSPVPLPGRKRKAKEPPPSDLPSPQKLKIDQPELPPSSPGIKPEPSSPEPVVSLRRLVNEACNFWPTPDNCRKSVSNHSDNRKAFAKAKSKELARLGLKRTKAFFREDGLVIEWRSDIPVWNDTLLPQNPRSQSTASPTKSSSDVSSININSETLKRKRDPIEIIDVDLQPQVTSPSKKSRTTESDLTTASNHTQSRPEQKTPSPKKAKGPGSGNVTKHWSEGLSKEAILRLGKDKAVSLRHEIPPPSSSSVAAPNSCEAKQKRSSAFMVPSLPPLSPPPKRPALPTRLTPSERKVVCAYSTSSSSEGYKKATSKVDTANSTTISKPQSNVDVDASLSRQSTAVFSECTNEVAPESAKEQHIEITLSNEAGAQTSQTVDPQVTRKPENTNDGSLSEAESREIERLCTEDICVDLPEYEMAEDFLRRFISLFDTNRSELELAYSNDALLSCRVPDVRPEFSSGTPLSSSSNSTLHVGRTKIIDQLNSLIGYYFSPVGVPNNTIHYDIAVLSREVINPGPEDGMTMDKEAVGGILATLHSEIIRFSSGLDHTMTLHQSFVLRRRTEMDDSGLDESKSKWPLIVVSHHMILRDELLLPPDQLSIC